MQTFWEENGGEGGLGGGNCVPDYLAAKDILKEQVGGQMDEAFLNELAAFNGKLLVAGMAQKGA